MRYIIPFATLCFLCFAACKVKCQDPSLYVQFEGYDSAALNHIVLRQYTKNSDFSKLTKINYSGISVARTTGVYSYNDGDTIPYGSFGVGSGYDYEFELPLAGRTYRLYGISFDQEKGESTFMNKYDNCSNTVTYNLDSATLTGKGFSQRADRPGGVTIKLKK